jgi:hypothetical protein
MVAVRISLFLSLLVAGCGGDPNLGPGAPYAIAVVSFTPGTGGGVGADQLPDVVLGPPHGGGTIRGDTDDVLSLGRGGVIVLELGQTIVDGPGTDLRVFENAFYAGGDPTAPFAEPGRVALSEDGVAWTEHPCDATGAPAYAGCAGVHPVLSAPGNGIDPRSDAAGGDAFDLADFGLARAKYVRITDSGVGPMGFDGTDGFDLDAVAVVHGE